jgi:transposase-like protein
LKNKRIMSVERLYQANINNYYSAKCPRCNHTEWNKKHGRTGDGGFKFIYTCTNCGMKSVYEVNGRGYTEELSFIDEKGKFWGVAR